MQAVPRATALCLALLLQLLLLRYCQAPQFPAPLRAFLVLDYTFPGLTLSCRRAFFSRELVACQGDSKVCRSPHLSQIKFCPAARSDSAQTHWKATGHGCVCVWGGEGRATASSQSATRVLTDQALPVVLYFFVLPPSAEQEHVVATQAVQQFLTVIWDARASLDQEPGQEQTQQ